MYRKNTASQYIYFVLVNASSGAALTGATVTAYRALDGGSQASATGTTTELANGQYRFNLSQADTNADYGSYLFTATNAVPVEKTVVFTAANPTDATAFGLSRLDAAVSSRMATFSLPTNFSSLAITVGGAVTVGTNNDKTGYSLTQSFPTHFANLEIAANGHVSAAVQSIANNSITASSIQGGAITTAKFAAGAIDATVLATDSITSSQIAASAVTEIQSGLATTTQLTTVETKVDAIDDYVDTEVAAVKAVTDKLNTTVELDGAVYRFTTNALEQGPSGNATVIVQPLSATQPEAVIGTRIPRAVGDVSPIPIDIYDSTGAAVNLTTLGNLEVCVETEANVDLQVVAHANLTISGPSNNKVTWTPNAASVATVAKHRWSLRVASNKKDIAHGVFEVLRVALSDV